MFRELFRDGRCYLLNSVVSWLRTSLSSGHQPFPIPILFHPTERYSTVFVVSWLERIIRSPPNSDKRFPL